MTDQPATVRLPGTDTPVPVTVPERLVTRQDEKGRAVQYVAMGVGPQDVQEVQQ